MPLPNRVTPFGDLEAHAARGLFLGIRGGRFHDPATQTVPGRPWASRRWICCDLEFKGRAAAFRAAGRKVWDGRRYTELFFCDEVTALAAGHRPCAECRRPAYLAFREALVRAGAFDAPPSADAMDLRLDAERRDGRAKRLHAAILDDLPDGAMIARDSQAWAVRGPRLLRWSHGGYVEAVARLGGEVQALTPPLSLAALRGGYAPAWHGSAQADPYDRAPTWIGLPAPSPSPSPARGRGHQALVRHDLHPRLAGATRLDAYEDRTGALMKSPSPLAGEGEGEGARKSSQSRNPSARLTKQRLPSPTPTPRWTRAPRTLISPPMTLDAQLKPGDHVFLVDGSNFIFRAYFQSMNQDRKYNYRSDGLPSGAVRLFAAKLLQFVRDGVLGVKPTHLAIIFDKSENSFRKALYPDYKANRSAPPADLVPQFPLMRDVVRAFGLTPVEQDTYEADDLIATYARQANAAGADVLIVSADKDLMQLIRPGVAMYDPASGDRSKGSYREERRIGEPEVVDYFGVMPDKVVDVQSLAGDSTDNVPGAPGIGVKTAAQLIGEFGSLDALLARAYEIKQPKRRETLTDPAIVERVRISQQLVKLIDDAPVETPLGDLTLPEVDARRLIAFLKAMEFTTITRRVAEAFEADIAAIDPEEALAPGGSRAAELKAVFAAAMAEAGEDGKGDLISARAAAGQVAPKPKPEAVTGELAGATPQQNAALIKEMLDAAKIDRSRYETVRDVARLKAWIAMAREAGAVAFDVETDNLDAMQAELVGFSLAVAPNVACYVPLLHRGGTDLFGGGLEPGQIPSAEAIGLIKPLLTDPSVLKIGQNLKYDWLVMCRHGVDIAPCDDTMLMSYVLDAGLGGHGMDRLSEFHLGHKPISFGEVAGTGKAQVTFDRVAIDKATEYAAEDADVTLRLWMLFKARLAASGRMSVYETLERPMIEVLGRMERRGVAIDRQILARLSGDFAQKAAALEDEIIALAGERFSVGSPKQLGDILFGKMGLPGGKKTATGQWATGANVLEELAEQGHLLPAKILEWRQLTKLKSTYTDALPTYLNPETKRIHTGFSLAATTTGRLSSSEPNLQNIPVRNAEGRQIRTAFVPEPGNRLISADYSQIELRLLAHMADIPQLRQAFADGADIHAITASEMFGVPLKEMTPDVRRRAKAINFGIIYGISAFGLAAQLGIGQGEAGAYIRKYFERFPGIRDYMDATKLFVKTHGYVKTLFGRVCHYPDATSSNPSQRATIERQAINAPIQGTAADIIRRAMIRMEDALEQAGLGDVRMLLQVHDELVFEAPEAKVERALPIIRKVMVDAPHPAVTLKVPLQVDARAAANWDEAH